MIRKALSIIFLLLFSVMSYSQNIQGRLLNYKDKTPVPYAIVQIEESRVWTTSDINGNFSFENVKLQNVTLLVKHLGMRDFQKVYDVSFFQGSAGSVELMPLSYDMQEVVVTAREGGSQSTTSVIESAALEHVQPTTIGDVLQLLPGNIIDNPDLMESQTVSIREIGVDHNSSAGTSVIVDGAPISNDANFQTYSTAMLETDFTNVTRFAESTAGEGVDLRQISTDNIESIEVVRGIPSVVYGNLTSGVVIVNTKSGYTPFEVKFKTDPRIKHAYVGKGVRFKNGGAFNSSIDYTRSFKDLRSKYTGFDRVTSKLSYSKVYFETTTPLSINTGLSCFQTLDSKKTDPDALSQEEYIRESESGLRFNLRAKLNLNKRMITGVRSDVSVSVNSQEYYAKTYRRAVTGKVSFSTEEGENEGTYLPAESLTELTIKGLPVNVFGNFIGNKYISFNNNSYNNILAGLEYKLSGNYGEGRLYDINNPPVVSLNSSRPRSFKDIPAVSYVAFLFEDKYVQPIGRTTLILQGGARINSFQPGGVSGSDVGVYVEPRFNAGYKIIDSEESLFKELTIHAGAGINYKAPSAIYLFPDLAYFDLVSLDYYTGNHETQMAYFTTSIYETSNKNLKPVKNFKREVGFDFGIGRVSGSVTAFYESMTDGLGMIDRFHFEDYKLYDTAGIVPGKKPVIGDLSYEYKTYTVGYSSPVNNKKSEKYGVEYSLDFGKLNVISTKVTMNGAWLRTKRINSTINYDQLPQSVSFGHYEEIGVYASGEARVNERLNTTFRFITHSPELRLVLTTTMQVTWYEKFYHEYYDESPLYLYSKDQDYIPFTEEMRSSPVYRNYVTNNGAFYYDEEIMPPLFLLNLKISKELYDRFKLSVYVNNFVNHRPLYHNERSLSYVRRNPSVYFGAELMMEL